MGITVSVKARVDGTMQFLNETQLRKLPRAVVYALNKTIDNCRVVGGREVRNHISLPAAFIRSQLVVKKAKASSWRASITPRVKNIPLTEFKPIVRQLKKLSIYGRPLQSVSVKVSPRIRRKVIHRGFYAYGRGIIAQRAKGKARGPIKMLHGPSVDNRFGMPMTQHLMQWRALLQFPKNFSNQIKRIMASTTA